MSAASCVIVFLALTVLWAPLARGQDPCVEDRLYQRVYSCFAQQGLQLPVQSGQQDANQLLRETQTVDPESQCKQVDLYKKATNCTLMTLRSCLALAGMEGAIPDVTRFQRGMDVVCSRRNELNTECLKSRYPDIITCGERTVRALAHNRQTDHTDIADIICLSADVNYDCASEYLKPCGNETLEIFLQQLDKYQVPVICVNRSPGRAGRKKYNVTSGSRVQHSTAFSFVSCLAAIISLASVRLLH